LHNAKLVGADVTINCKTHDLHQTIFKETNGDGVGRILDATGSAPLVNKCFKLLRKGGYVCLVGLPKEPLFIEDPLPNIIFKSLTIKTVHGRRIFHDWIEAEKYLHQGLLVIII
jgi:threonine dehydrogenase-like Zn-dependent dehydrogenase